MPSGKDTPVPMIEDPLAELANTNEENIEVIADRYVVTKKLGQGGMGRVFRAHDKLLDRDVAVKLLNRELRDDYFVRRFQQEARAASQLNHMNILCVLDFGLVSQTQPYLVMEWVDGAALDEVMEGGRLSIRHAVEICIKLTEGMQHAHRNGIIHRDLKPSNIMLSRSELGERVLILDFGIAKMVDDPTELGMLTMTGQIMGSPRCISPEQARGEPLDGRSDIYSLGCVMFEMFSGKPPYRGDTAMTTISMHLNEPIPSISDVSDIKFPDGLEDIIRKTMAKMPTGRFASMEELRDQLLQLDLNSIIEEESDSCEAAEVNSPGITFGTIIKQLKRFAPHVLVCLLVLIVLIINIASKDEHHADRILSKAAKKKTEAQFSKTDLSIRNSAMAPDSEVTKQFETRFAKARGLAQDDMVIDNSAKSGADLKQSLSSHPEAFHLRMYKVTITPDMVDVIERARPLTELRFQSCVIPPGLQVRICKMKKLNALKFVDMPVSIVAIKQAAKLPKLIDFQIYEGKLNDDAIKEISTMTNLEVLEIKDNEEKFSPSVRPKLKALKQLKQLRLDSTGIDDSDLAWISTLDRLDSLGLSSNGPFSPRALRQLANLPNLTMLYLDNTGLDAACLMAVAKIHRLELLDISKNEDITIGGLQHLAHRPNLQVVVFETGIPKENLKAIAKQLNITLSVARPAPGSSKLMMDLF